MYATFTFIDELCQPRGIAPRQISYSRPSRSFHNAHRRGIGFFKAMYRQIKGTLKLTGVPSSSLPLITIFLCNANHYEANNSSINCKAIQPRPRLPILKGRKCDTLNLHKQDILTLRCEFSPKRDFQHSHLTCSSRPCQNLLAEHFGRRFNTQAFARCGIQLVADVS
jgi:hypothetical protein